MYGCVARSVALRQRIGNGRRPVDESRRESCRTLTRRRQPANNQAMNCRLCLQPRTLVKSHIIPELVWTRAYGPLGFLRSAKRGQSYLRTLRRGLREPMLCDHCDRKVLGRYESYFARVWYGKKRFPRRIPPDVNVLTTRDIDYTAFKLFHLAVLWRAAVAVMPDFAAVDLGNYGERIRLMLLNGNAGRPDLFPVAGTVVVSPHTRSPMFDLMALPVPYEDHSRVAYAGIYAACIWRVVLGEGVQLIDRVSEGIPLSISVATLDQLTGLLEVLEPHFRK